MITIIISFVLFYDIMFYSCFAAAHRADVVSGYYVKLGG